MAESLTPELRSWLEKAYPILASDLRRSGSALQADDVLQDILVHFIEKKAQFSSFEMLLAHARRLARWRTIDSYRRRFRESAVGDLRDLEQLAPRVDATNPEATVVAQDLIAHRLERLPPREHALMRLILSGEHPEAAASKLGMAPATGRSFLRRARYHLSQMED